MRVLIIILAILLALLAMVGLASIVIVLFRLYGEEEIINKERYGNNK